MKTIYTGRYTARVEGPFVVFVIGVRINKLLAMPKWLPVVQAMGPMMRELYANPELGFLHTEMSFHLRGVTMIQYWRSMEHLEHYARQGGLHLAAWRAFNQKVGSNPAVGIFHETYLVPAGNYEAVYNHMPAYGLARAGEHEPVSARTDSARQRLDANASPEEELMR